MKSAALRFWSFLSSDRGIIVLMILMIALLAFGGVKLSSVVASNMLQTDARSTSSAWATSLGESVDIPALLSGAPLSEKTSHFLESASQVGDIYRYKLWDRSGHLAFSSTRSGIPPLSTALAASYSKHVADTLRFGSQQIESRSGESVSDPSYFAASYIPIKQNDAVIGVLEVYLDQTSDRAFYERSFLLTECIIAIAVLLAGGLPAFLVYRKMAAHRAAQAEALFLADHDNLTGIANRKWLVETAKGAISWAKRSKTYAAVLLMDMDRFKEINDSFGHNAGDEVLKTFAERLKSTIRTEDTVARLGGDEFVILQVGMAQPAGARSLASRLLEALSAPYTIGQLQSVYTTSIGVAIAPTDADNWDMLLACADAALYKAKAEGGNAVCFFETGMDKTFHERRQLEVDLRRAIHLNAFQLAYQPLFSFHDGNLIGFEALLRWPEAWAPQPPSAFIPVAEESGLIVPLGAWVLEAACTAAAAWTKPLKVSINLSPTQFRHGDIVATVQAALTKSKLDPARLELEVTESLWIQNTDAVLDQLENLRAMGISIALDDFGTGYSSLAYLWKFPFDTVKIDRSFVTEMDHDPKAQAIVNTIVALGKTLDLTVTAEGVETPAQAQTLKDVGCDQVQGYLFGRPLSDTSANTLIDSIPSPTTFLS